MWLTLLTPHKIRENHGVLTSPTPRRFGAMPTAFTRPVGRPALQDISNRTNPTRNADASPPKPVARRGAEAETTDVVDFENRAVDPASVGASDRPTSRREVPASDLSFFLPQQAHAQVVGGADRPPGAPTAPSEPAEVLHDGAVELFRQLDDDVNTGKMEWPTAEEVKRPSKRRGTHRDLPHFLRRAEAMDWDDSQSIKRNFPPYKDKVKYGQLNPPPRFLLRQYRDIRSKARFVCSWRRMSPRQHKTMKDQCTQAAAAERELTAKLRKAETAIRQEEKRRDKVRSKEAKGVAKEARKQAKK